MSISDPIGDRFPKQSEEVGVTANRSAIMAKVRGKNTRPEMIVRRLAHGHGYRFRLHGRALPGSPDLVFSRRRKVIFVHGCFWHRHADCTKTTTPKIRAAFWQAKFDANVARDARDGLALRNDGWEVLVVWECETRNAAALAAKLTTFLGPL